MTIPAPEDIAAELAGAREELASAQLNLKNGLFRPAVAAAYYAIFHAARAALWSRGKNAKTHRGLAFRFREEFAVPGEVGADLFRILDYGREQRERADYDLTKFEVTREAAQATLDDARKFAEEMEKLIRKPKSHEGRT